MRKPYEIMLLFDICTKLDKLEIRQAEVLRGAMHWLWFLIIGVMAGGLSGKLTRGRGFGLVGDLVVGILGALLGGFLFGLLGIVSAGG